jgi:hypothetical protein
MSKKYFIIFTLSGVLLLLSILPIINYTSDPSRIFHKDYKTQYKNFHPNKLFLKVIYLMENKEKFDTLVFGSSRGGFVDVSAVSPDAYNMSHGFGTISTYLHILKTLLENGVKVQNVWLGVNDFAIWKDHTNALHKLTYKNGYFANVPLYAEWLFRIRTNALELWMKREPLLATHKITDTKVKVDSARKGELLIRTMKRDIQPATLGYTGIFRIDETVEEMREIKTLCNQHGINLTVFTYPAFFRTYLRYDQNKIEEFKRKLVTVVDFYDFYELGDISINQHKWFEGSHFTPSVGDFLIDNIKKNNNLVTPETIDARMIEVKSLMKNLSTLPLREFKTYSGNLDLDIFNIIFDINNSEHKYIANDDFKLHNNDGVFDVEVTRNDPHLILNETKSNLKRTILTFHIHSDVKTDFKIYFKKDLDSGYNEKDTYKMHIKRGLNSFSVIIPAVYINNEIRVDFVKHTGHYQIKKFVIHEL